MSLKDKASSFEINPEQLGFVTNELVDLLDKNGQMIDFSPQVILSEQIEKITYLSTKDIYYVFREAMDNLRLRFDSVFDMPSARFLRQLDKDRVVHESRRNIFERLICRPFPDDPAAPLIIARWQMEHQKEYMQLGIAYDTSLGPKYVFKAILTEGKEDLTLKSPREKTEIAINQEREYWNLIFMVARKNIERGNYPFSCLIEPNGRFNPLVIARNSNRHKGEGFDGHAEHMALVTMNNMFYKSMDTFHPNIFSLALPCHSCAQMIREQGELGRSVREVKFLLKQPPGWGGIGVLRNPLLNSECGRPPIITHVPDFQGEALTLIKEVNQFGGICEGQFNKMIAVNSV